MKLEKTKLSYNWQLLKIISMSIMLFLISGKCAKPLTIPQRHLPVLYGTYEH